MQDKGYLVTLEVYFIGGSNILVTDAFRAENEPDAKNMAINVFIDKSNTAVMYGDALIVVDALAAIYFDEAEEIDLADPENKKWLDSVDVFEQFMEREHNEQRRQRGPRTAITESGSL